MAGRLFTFNSKGCGKEKYVMCFLPQGSAIGGDTLRSG